MLVFQMDMAFRRIEVFWISHTWPVSHGMACLTVKTSTWQLKEACFDKVHLLSMSEREVSHQGMFKCCI